MFDPLICEITRGNMVESRHRVHAMICDASGPVQTWGDPDLMFYPRSAIKFMQSLPLLESGAADAYGVATAELALASASHSGTAEHVAAVAAWLKRIGLGADNLGCGAHVPYDSEAANDLVRAGAVPTRLNNNCSGKHTGFLTTALHLHEPIDSYLDSDHPVQRRLYDILETLGGQSLADTGRGHDGCGIPVYGMTLRALATAVQKMADPSDLGEQRGAAVQRVLAAVTAMPFMVGGPGRFDTDVMTALGGTVATKGGAEGVHIAIIPGKKLGIALKAEDGEKRAADIAMGWLLQRAGMIGSDAEKKLVKHLQPTIYNTTGKLAGVIRIAA
ncbi:MAG: asparaginase [Rhodospirillales bacterium]|jgi:L-asparaginase II|nr:asparaginase [Rhodospirillales bacterium]